MYATDNQLNFLEALARKSAHGTVIAVANAYGIGFKSASTLSVGEASELISFLRNGVSAEAHAKADADRAAFLAKYNLTA